MHQKDNTSEGKLNIKAWNKRRFKVKIQALCFKALYSSQNWAANIKYEIPRIQ